MSSDTKSKAEHVESTNVKVMVRMRLFNKREMNISAEKHTELRPCVRMRGNTCAVLEFSKDEKGFMREREREAFDFDECFWSMPAEQCAFAEKPYATQEMVYQRSGQLALRAALEGFHVCLFAYGQTGSGKTYSMLGSREDPGVSPRLVDDLFRHASKNTNPALRISVECMFFEIYNERVRDLFNKKSTTGEYDNPKIRSGAKGVYVEGLIRKECADAEQTKAFIEKGTLERAMAETKMNPTSSRSHAIFQILVTQNDGMRGTQKMSFINLVDLAGSERIRQSQVTGSSLVEATNINKSLSTLRRVIDILIENSTTRKQQVPPFRESVLTYVLSDSLGGNSKTQMIATISPHEANLEDTIGTLRYALRARSIVCQAKVNEEESAAMLQQMREEILRLRQRALDGTLSAEGSGSVAMLPEDVQREIAEKEAEMAKMEAEQSKMEELVQQMKSQMQEMDLAKQELAVAITEQKRERFAAAFRNAFLISTDKRRIAENLADLSSLRDENAELRRQLSTSRRELDEKNTHGFRLAQENHQLQDSVQRLRTEYDELQVKLDALQRSFDETKHTFEKQLSSSESTVTRLEAERDSLQRRVDSQKSDLTGLTHAAEREELEKRQVRKQFEDAVMNHMRELDELRQKKTRYKLQLAEERQKYASTEQAAKTHDAERKSLLETIKALQVLTKEKDFLVDIANKQREAAQQAKDELQRTLDNRDQTIRVLQTALQEYESASAQWMADLSVRDREIARFQGMVRGSHDKAAFPHGGGRPSTGSDMQWLRDEAQRQSTPVRSRMPYPSTPQPAHRTASPSLTGLGSPLMGGHVRRS